MIESVAVVMTQNNQVLIVKKDPDHKLAGLWEFPGGKLEAGESLEACIKREMQEELAVDVEMKELLVTYFYPLPRNTLKINAYFANPLSDQMTLMEHIDLRWVEIEALRAYDFVPSDLPVVEALEKWTKK
jgi:mutator protein MutT